MNPACHKPRESHKEASALLCLCNGPPQRRLELRAVLIQEKISRSPQHVKGVRDDQTTSLSSPIQMDFFLRLNELPYKWTEHTRPRTLQLHLACLLFCGFCHRSLLSPFFQRMYVTSSARPRFITTFPSTGTVTSSGCTSAMQERRTSATRSSLSFCRYTFRI